MGRVFSIYGQHLDAALRFEAAAREVHDAASQTILLADAALQYARAGSRCETESIVQAIKDRVTSGEESELRLLKLLQTLA
jgi:hypothetical protein